MAAARFENRVMESSTSTGTGTIALQAVAGWRRFADVLAVAETCHYVITAVDAVGRATGEAEWGIGTIAANNTLARTTVIGSSNAGAKVAFAEGMKMVALTALAPATATLQADWRAAIGLDKVDNTSDKLKPVSDAAKDALDAKVAKAGDVLSGDLNIQKGWPSLILSRADGSTSAQLIGQKNRSTRWSVDLGNSTAESGANNGSNFAINRFSDTAAYIDTPLQVLRSTGDTLVKSLSASGSVSVTGTVTTKSLTIDKGGMTVSGWLPDGANYYSQVLFFNPAWDNISFQGYHAPNDWAGARLIVGSSSPSVFEFRAGGSIRINGSLVQTSDGRVKTDLRVIEHALDKVERCCGYTYLRIDLVDEFKAVQPRHMGLIAQDVLAVAPEAVLRAGDERGTLSINYDALTGLLVNAIKELRGEVRAAKAQIDGLVARLEALERR